ncbi:hypothetical protein [Nocardia terpenica]|uniref:Uncharacterized protein n=1 Tax=Nocardia terpenica TaxID=455432 RepID=A0A291RYS7_9NOCA|nr:hypothetical protein [Nocardia terpenica]ATL72480.1 hypothetical protein CRH09_39590 [Nocardia terpenica]
MHSSAPGAFRGARLSALLSGTARDVTAAEAVAAVNMLRWHETLTRLFAEHARIMGVTTLDAERKAGLSRELLAQVDTVARLNPIQPYPLVLPSSAPPGLVDTAVRVLVALLLAAGGSGTADPLTSWLRDETFTEAAAFVASSDAAVLIEFAAAPAPIREGALDLVKAWLAGAESFVAPVPLGGRANDAAAQGFTAGGENQ